jgi:DNA-nicking Smr family endonuclease
VSRALSPDERALWARVTAGVAAEEAARRPVRLFAEDPVPTPSRVSRAPGTTLDASWDRNLRLGEVEPDRVVDLHGLTVDAAHARAVSAVEAAARRGDRVVVLITGKPPAAGTNRLDAPLRGIIRASINDWLAASAAAPHIAAIRAAHRKHGGDGAIYVVIRRKRAPAT